MLREFHVKNFRTLLDVRINLQPLTVFIGPNNSGKSNMVRAIKKFAELHKGQQVPQDWAASPKPLSYFVVVDKDGDDFQLNVQWPNDSYPQGIVSLRISGAADFQIDVGARSQELKGFGGANVDSSNPAGLLKSLLTWPKTAPPSWRQVSDFFAATRVISLSVPSLRAPASIGPKPELGERGEGFAAVLDDIAGNNPRIKKVIDQELARVAPGVSGFTTQASATGQKVAALIENDAVYPASDVSDGLLLYLGITTAAQLTAGSLLIIEEPENGIHPRRLRALLDQLRNVVKAGTQVILTTHSPLIVSEFRDTPEAVVVFDRDPTLGTRVRMLDENEPMLKDLGEMSLGDLWTSGAIGGVPAL